MAVTTILNCDPGRVEKMFYLYLALPLSISGQFQMVCEISYCTNRPPLFFKSWHLTYKTLSFITFLTLPIQANVLLRSLNFFEIGKFHGGSFLYKQLNYR